MPRDDHRSERDLILAPNEYAYLLDETKGNVINYVGPHKTSLANTDQPVIFNAQTKRFEHCTLQEAKQPFAIAPEGWYLVLKNPSEDGKFPKIGTANTLPDLDIGRKVAIPGPVSISPWPGQMVRVIKGHNLRSNQYLVVRVYDEEAARENWSQAVIKPQTSAEGVDTTVETPDLTIGRQLVIKGTDIAFYIPPTGIEVVPTIHNRYVRNAVTLERLEYCILLDEDGNKRYIKGPAVVFPEPTETFVEKGNSRKFKAIELDENSGIYIKVIAPYEEAGQSYHMGDELFVTGKDQMIYFPRTEHAIIRYGDNDVYQAATIPAGEALYVLNRLSGQINLVRGPMMFLPDPRREVIVRRILDPRQVELWYPGNKEALAYNRLMQEVSQKQKGQDYLLAPQQTNLGLTSVDEVEALTDWLAPEAPQAQEKKPATSVDAEEEFVGDQFTRTFSFPRTITLDTKYEGAVAVNVWTGYAVLVISKTGERKVIVGPQNYLLEYDEILGTIELSKGTPKTDKNRLKTVYLRALNNKVSDMVEATTNDFCDVAVTLSYRVNFEGDSNRWFNVENYVKFLTDHMRSVLINTVKGYGIEPFYDNAITIIRDAVLGQVDAEGRRTGRLFEENGMRIYDVEILSVEIKDDEIAMLLIDDQHTKIKRELELAAEQRNQKITEEQESIKQSIAKSKAETQQLLLALQLTEVEKSLAVELAKTDSTISLDKKLLTSKLEDQTTLDQINGAEIARDQALANFRLEVSQREMTQQLEQLKAEVEAVVDKAGAVSPDLVAALQAFSDKALAEKMAESMAPLAILGGNSVADVLSQLLQGTILEKVLQTSKQE